jgi:hypothetical protein
MSPKVGLDSGNPAAVVHAVATPAAVKPALAATAFALAAAAFSALKAYRDAAAASAGSCCYDVILLLLLLWRHEVSGGFVSCRQRQFLTEETDVGALSVSNRHAMSARNW